MRYYIADQHFFHESLNRQMDCRGFENAQAMNDYMISQWNSRVRDRDEVVILGDLSVAKGKATNAIVSQLRGKLFLIEGNHDDFIHDRHFDAGRFEWIRPYAELYDNKRKVILCHYPVFCYNGQFLRGRDGKPKTWMLHGHIHKTPDEALVRQFGELTRQSKRFVRSKTSAADGGYEEIHVPCQMINCFCTFSDYVPLTLDEWILKNEERSRSLLFTAGQRTCCAAEAGNAVQE